MTAAGQSRPRRAKPHVHARPLRPESDRSVIVVRPVALCPAVAPVAYCVRGLTEMDALIRLMALLLSAGRAATRFGA